MIASKYRLEELLGSGGMGHVYRAVNVRAGRTVAIKILRSEHATNAPIVERFLREALAANLVRHPNVVDVLDVDKDDDGSPYIVQELLSGEDFESYVKSRGGRVNLQEVEELLLPVIDAVAEAHARGVVHRDIKPENVFLARPANATIGSRKQLVPKLLDFGISKVRLPDIKMTDVGVMMGTPAYMAPEQVTGGSRDADPRADVWALGVMLWEVLVGRLPFDSTDAPALFVAIATKDIPSMLEADPSLDPHVARVVARCTRRNIDERYPTAAELARDLRHVLEGTDIEPTQRRSIPPLAAKEGADRGGFDIPDLIMPAPARVPELPSNPTAAHGALELEPPPAQRQITAALPPSQAHPPPSVPALPVATAPSSRREPAAHTPPAQLDGVMMSGSAISQRRPGPPPSMYQPRELDHDKPADPSMKLIGALGVAGLVPILTTAVLMTFLYAPEGWNVVAALTKPEQPILMIIQGGLAVAGVAGAGSMSRAAFQRMRGIVAGGVVGAIVHAAIGGAFLFVALQLGKAAF